MNPDEWSAFSGETILRFAGPHSLRIEESDVHDDALASRTHPSGPFLRLCQLVSLKPEVRKGESSRSIAIADVQVKIRLAPKEPVACDQNQKKIACCSSLSLLVIQPSRVSARRESMSAGVCCFALCCKESDFFSRTMCTVSMQPQRAPFIIRCWESGSCLFTDDYV